METLIVLCAVWLAPPLLYTAAVLVLDLPQRPSISKIIRLLAPAAAWLTGWPLVAELILSPAV
jgi:hypothetical protein